MVTIVEVMDACGCSRQTIVKYVQRGLLPKPSSGGRGATYEPETLRRCRYLKARRDRERLGDLVERWSGPGQSWSGPIPPSSGQICLNCGQPVDGGRR